MLGRDVGVPNVRDDGLAPPRRPVEIVRVDLFGLLDPSSGDDRVVLVLCVGDVRTEDFGDHVTLRVLWGDDVLMQVIIPLGVRILRVLQELSPDHRTVDPGILFRHGACHLGSLPFRLLLLV